MGDLRVGFDYHLADVHRTLSYGDGVRLPAGSRKYFAVCDACGWMGPQRMTSAAAHDDAAAHDTTENG
jgi:hypothetical protein